MYNLTFTLKYKTKRFNYSFLQSQQGDEILSSTEPEKVEETNSQVEFKTLKSPSRILSSRIVNNILKNRNKTYFESNKIYSASDEALSNELNIVHYNKKINDKILNYHSTQPLTINSCNLKGLKLNFKSKPAVGKLRLTYREEFPSYQLKNQYNVTYYDENLQILTNSINSSHPSKILETVKINLFREHGESTNRPILNRRQDNSVISYKNSVLSKISEEWNTRSTNAIKSDGTIMLGNFKLKKSILTPVLRSTINNVSKLMKQNTNMELDHTIEKLSRLMLSYNIVKNTRMARLVQPARMQLPRIQWVQLTSDNIENNLEITTNVSLGRAGLCYGSNKKSYLEYILFMFMDTIPTASYNIGEDLFLVNYSYDYRPVIPREFTIYCDNVGEATRIWQSFNEEYYLEENNFLGLVATISDYVGPENLKKALHDNMFMAVNETQIIKNNQQSQLSYIPFSLLPAITLVEHVSTGDNIFDYSSLFDIQILFDILEKNILFNTIIFEAIKNTFQKDLPKTFNNDPANVVSLIGVIRSQIKFIFSRSHSIINNVYDTLEITEYYDYNSVYENFVNYFPNNYRITTYSHQNLTFPTLVTTLPTYLYFHIMDPNFIIKDTIAEVFNTLNIILSTDNNNIQSLNNAMSASWAMNFLYDELENNVLHYSGLNYLVTLKQKDEYVSLNPEALENVYGLKYYLNLSMSKSVFTQDKEDQLTSEYEIYSNDQPKTKSIQLSDHIITNIVDGTKNVTQSEPISKVIEIKPKITQPVRNQIKITTNVTTPPIEPVITFTQPKQIIEMKPKVVVKTIQPKTINLSQPANPIPKIIPKILDVEDKKILVEQKTNLDGNTTIVENKPNISTKQQSTEELKDTSEKSNDCKIIKDQTSLDVEDKVPKTDTNLSNTRKSKKTNPPVLGINKAFKDKMMQIFGGPKVASDEHFDNISKEVLLNKFVDDETSIKDKQRVQSFRALFDQAISKNLTEFVDVGDISKFLPIEIQSTTRKLTLTESNWLKDSYDKYFNKAKEINLDLTGFK